MLETQIFAPLPEKEPKLMDCDSWGFKHKSCPIPQQEYYINWIELVQQRSKSGCNEHQSWWHENYTLDVDNGCRAKFKLYTLPPQFPDVAAYAQELANFRSAQEFYQPGGFFYRDTVPDIGKPAAKENFRAKTSAEVGCRGLKEVADLAQNKPFKLLANNEGDGSKRIYASYNCHNVSCGKTRQACWTIFARVTAGQELTDPSGVLQAPLPPNSEVQCMGSSEWKAQTQCEIVTHNGDGWSGMSMERHLAGKTTVNTTAPATTAPSNNSEDVYKKADFLNQE